jgi:pilus assembly protein CpaF
MKKIITVLNLKDGAGRTTISLLLASVLAKEFSVKTAVFEQGTGVFDAPAYCGSGFAREGGFDEKLGFSLACGEDPSEAVSGRGCAADVVIVDVPGMPDTELLEMTNIFLIPVLPRADYIKRANYITAALLAMNYPTASMGIVINKNDKPLFSREELGGIFNDAGVLCVIPDMPSITAAAEKGMLCGITLKKEKQRAPVPELAAKLLDMAGKPGAIRSGKAAGARPQAEFFSEKAGYQDVKKSVRRKVLAGLDIVNMEKDALTHPAKKAAIFEDIKKKIRAMLDTEPDAPAAADVREFLLGEIFNEVAGLGAIERFLEDESVSEVMVNGCSDIYVESAGMLYKTGASYTDDASVMRAIERIVFPLGRRIDESSPYVDARLSDGSRVNAVIPPLALNGPVLTVRKFSRNKLSAAGLVKCGSLTVEAAGYLEQAVLARDNILISGGTGSGKTTLLNALSSFIPGGERIITIEDSAELKLEQEHVVRLEARPANMEGAGAVSIRDLVKNCLRMRPDRIIVGECRAGETLDMLQAMNTGHDGSMTTVHSNSPRDAVSRLEVMALMSGIELPVRALREQIKGAIDLIIQQARMNDGTRRVTHITRITGMDNENILMHDVFKICDPAPGQNGHGILKRADII